MAFTTLQKLPRGGPLGGGRESRPAVSFSKYEKQSGHICITSALMQQIGWKPGDKVEVALGTGPDFGALRIGRSATGYTLSPSGSKKSKGSKFVFNHFNDTVARWAPDELKHSIAGGYLYVRLPNALLAAKTAPQQAEAQNYRNGTDQRVSA